MSVKMTQKEIYHLLFLAEVVLSDKKMELMDDAFRCLMYVVKATEEVEVTEAVADQVKQILSKIEHALREENERLKDMNHLVSRDFVNRSSQT